MQLGWLLWVACGDAPTTTPPDDSDPEPPDTDTETDTEPPDPTGDTAPAATGDTAPTTVAACHETGAGLYEGPTSLVEMAVECDPNDVNVRYSACTRGWTANGQIYLQETGNPPPNWAESHDLVSVSFDAMQWWDDLEQVVRTGVNVADQAPNQSSLFTCPAFYEAGVMTYAFLVYDLDGSPADCVVWGQDPQAMIDGTIERVNEPPFDLANCTIAP